MQRTKPDMCGLDKCSSCGSRLKAQTLRTPNPASRPVVGTLPGPISFSALRTCHKWHDLRKGPNRSQRNSARVAFRAAPDFLEVPTRVLQGFGVGMPFGVSAVVPNMSATTVSARALSSVSLKAWGFSGFGARVLRVCFRF